MIFVIFRSICVKFHYKKKIYLCKKNIIMADIPTTNSQGFPSEFVSADMKKTKEYILKFFKAAH